MRRAGSIKKVPWRTAVLPALAFLLFSPHGVFASDTVALNLFPTEAFHRDPGKPTAEVRTFTVPATQGTFVLHVVNGDGATDNLVSSAVVRVNGATIVRPSDLSQQVTALDLVEFLLPVLAFNNEIRVVAASLPVGLRVGDPQ